IPSRDPVLAPLIRSIFVPFEQDVQWVRVDYSQIEYRMLVHFAKGAIAEQVRKQFRDDPTTDYHDCVIHLLYEMTGLKLARKPAKNINFGLIYGMGIPKLIRSLGMTKEEGKRVFEAYHQAIP